MKSKGIHTVYVAGHSLGAIAAAGYGARYEDIQGIIIESGHLDVPRKTEKVVIEWMRKM